MRLDPNNLQLLTGETGIVMVSDFDPEAEVTITVVPNGSVTATLTDSLLSVTATSATGIKTVTLVQGTQSATLTVTVSAASEYVALTADGSGTGNDTTVFGRQYVINQNIGKIDDVMSVIQRTVNTIRTLSITNQATNAANLALVIANLGVCLNQLGQIKTLVKVTGKTTTVLADPEQSGAR